MDFVQGWIRVLDPSRPGEPSAFAAGLRRPVDLAFAPDGALYVLERDSNRGSLHRSCRQTFTPDEIVSS